MLGHADAAPRGRYRFKLKAPGNRARLVGGLRLADGRFPVRGPHDYGGAVQRFGAPAAAVAPTRARTCSHPAERPWWRPGGGRVQSRGTDPVLYGNWVVIDGRGTSADHRVRPFPPRPASVRDGERVRTGDRIGRGGRIRNARTVGCMLHFEAWPSGWLRRSPADPLSLLRRWDRWP